MHQPVTFDVSDVSSVSFSLPDRLAGSSAGRSTFEIGEMVALKSGGPAMTVREVGRVPAIDGVLQEIVMVDWFVGPNLARNLFPAACLVPMLASGSAASN